MSGTRWTTVLLAAVMMAGCDEEPPCREWLVTGKETRMILIGKSVIPMQVDKRRCVDPARGPS